MNRKVVIAGLFAGLVVVLWGMASHMALGLGEMGVSALPNEAATLAAIGQQVPQGGLYLFPIERDPAQWDASYQANPHGLLVTTPAGAPFAFGRRLGLEFVANVAGGILLAFLAVRLAGPLSWARGAGIGVALGLFAHFSIDASYVIWYDFPMQYGLAQLIDQTIGWGLAGAITGWYLGRR